MVVANAINAKNQRAWVLPAYSAFTDSEIKAVKSWVEKGGKLLLIADHMPFPGAAYDLAKVFGFKMSNGFAMKKNRKRGQLDKFNRKANTLRPHAVTNGRESSEKIDQLISFTGQAFQIPKKAKPLFVFPKGYQSLLPDTAWRFRPHTKRIEVEGWAQGAVLNDGKGKIAVFGEAAMFTSQVVNNGKLRFGMLHPKVRQNPQFVLNVIHWLDGKLE